MEVPVLHQDTLLPCAASFWSDIAEIYSSQGLILAAYTQLGLDATHPLSWVLVSGPRSYSFPGLA